MTMMAFIVFGDIIRAVSRTSMVERSEEHRVYWS
jgi:hypothetical protein